MQTVILIGIQASGKSTFYSRYFAETHLRISLDMLKTRHRERVLLAACISIQQPFVVDNTNATAAERAVYISRAKAAGFQVIGYFLRSSVREAIRRNRRRPDSKNLPVKGISATYRRLQVPTLEEGFDSLYLVDITPSDEFLIRVWPEGVEVQK
jgi:predicted kinase